MASKIALGLKLYNYRVDKAGPLCRWREWSPGTFTQSMEWMCPDCDAGREWQFRKKGEKT